MSKTKKLRDEAKYRLLPPLDAETYAGIKANIAVNGVQVPVVRDEKGYILDGFARAQIAKELGYECLSVTVKGLTEQEKRSQVRALNLARRHLDSFAKRQIIADELRENPRRSNRWIAKSLGVHHATVIAVRHELSATGHVIHLDQLVGRDGKTRSATGSIPPTVPEQPDRRTYYNFRLGKLRPRASDQETPPGLSRFLFETISPKYEVQTILDPCAGRGAMTMPWRGRRVISFEIETGADFFESPDRIECDLVLCNPPFSQDGEGSTGYQPERFLRRIVEVVPPHNPIVLITPMGMRLHQEKRSKRWRWLRDEAPPITSIISLPRDAFPSVDYHVEILLFNMPKLKPHFFLPDRYL
jgi:ParB-like nuclease domain